LHRVAEREASLMTTTSFHVFEKTVQKSYAWLNDLMTELGWQDRHHAYVALRVTLHALRDQLTVDEAVHLGAQFPMLIRGLYYEGWVPSRVPRRERHLDEFLDPLEDAFAGTEAVDVEEVARAVFLLLSRRISEGEIEDVRHVLPPQLRGLWP
jgi:uncharacterized protein (DUF2267 family)